jgi:hypothetical protein
MNQNPYANDPYGGSPYGGGMEAGHGPTRTSVLAVLSIVFSLICILPGTGVIGILLGVGALAAISRSNGRLEGKGAALSGVILGLITTVLWAAIAIGALQGWTYYTERMIPTGDRFFTALSVGDVEAARAELSVEANEAVSDERLAWFNAQIESNIGPVQDVATSFDTIGQSFGRVFQQSQGGGPPQQTTVTTQNNDAVVPIGVLGASGSMIAWVVYDEQTIAGGPKTTPKMRDVFVQFENQSIVALRAGGPGQAAAGNVGGGEIIEGPTDEAPEDPPEPPATDEPQPEESTEPAPM